MRRFKFLRAYFSPFKPPRPRFYIGRVTIGTPYFLPRKWVKSKDKPGYMTAIPKKIGFDFVPLGWKTKWGDYRFEWSPIWSFVFFKWQIAIIFDAPHASHYWECWLYYSNDTDKKQTTRDRIKQCREKYPCIWTVYENGSQSKVDYYEKILKNKFVNIS